MKSTFFSLFLFLSLTVQAQLQNPSDFIPGYGTQVSYYHELEDYFAHLVSNSDYIRHKPYGETYQGRSLNVYYISSPQNLKDIESIRENHLFNIGLSTVKPTVATDKAIIWLSFNVHGNEIGAAESAMQVAYDLV